MVLVFYHTSYIICQTSTATSTLESSSVTTKKTSRVLLVKFCSKKLEIVTNADTFWNEYKIESMTEQCVCKMILKLVVKLLFKMVQYHL